MKTDKNSNYQDESIFENAQKSHISRFRALLYPCKHTFLFSIECEDERLVFCEEKLGQIGVG